MGEGKKKEDSDEIVKPNVAAGQTVMYSKYSGTEFEVRSLLVCAVCFTGMKCTCMSPASPVHLHPHQ